MIRLRPSRSEEKSRREQRAALPARSRLAQGAGQGRSCGLELTARVSLCPYQVPCFPSLCWPCSAMVFATLSFFFPVTEFLSAQKAHLTLFPAS